MAIVVIAIHTEPLVKCNNESILTIYKVVTDMAVPFFFLSSGYLVFEKILGQQKNIQETKIKNYIKKILRLYLIWNIIYLPVTIYDYVMNGESLKRNLFAFIKGLIFVGCHWNSWPLWYLLSVLYTFLFLYFCLYKRNMNKIVIMITTIIIYLIANKFTILVESNAAINGSLGKIVTIAAKIFGNGRLFTGAFYITAGFLIAFYYSNLKNNKIIIGIIFIMCIYGKIVLNGLQERCALAILSVSFFILILFLDIPESRIWSFCRKMSTKLFLLHMLIYSGLDIIIIKNRYAVGLVCFIITVLVTMLLSIILLYFEKRNGQLKDLSSQGP